MPIQVHVIESEPFAENSYVVWDDAGTEAVVVDPGFEPESILDFLMQCGLHLVAILNTHGHVDHIAGNRGVKAAHPAAPIYIGRGDAEMLVDSHRNLSAAFGLPVTSPPADVLVHEGDRLTLAGLTFDCWDVPGHSPGHIVFFVADATPPRLLGGDVLFQGSVGRTDFPGGSFDQLAAGIRAKLWRLPADTIVYPGHGPTTTIGIEKRTNPYVGGMG